MQFRKGYWDGSFPIPHEKEVLSFRKRDLGNNGSAGKLKQHSPNKRTNLFQFSTLPNARIFLGFQYSLKNKKVFIHSFNF